MFLVDHRNVDRIFECKKLSMKINEDKASAGPQSVSCLPAKTERTMETHPLSAFSGHPASSFSQRSAALM